MTGSVSPPLHPVEDDIVDDDDLHEDSDEHADKTFHVLNDNDIQSDVMGDYGESADKTFDVTDDANIESDIMGDESVDQLGESISTPNQSFDEFDLEQQQRQSTPVREKRKLNETLDINVNEESVDKNASFEKHVPKRKKPSELNKKGTDAVPPLIKSTRPKYKKCKDILDGCEEELLCCNKKFHTTCIR